jgi:hypothetical protein
LFAWLVSQLSGKLQRTSHTAASTLSAEKQIAIALYRWAHGSSYKVVSDVFACGRSTVHKCSHQVADAIITELMANTIRYPARDDVDAWREIASAFARRGIPNAVGAIDGTHFEIAEPPLPFGSDSIEHAFMDRRGLFSIAAQAVVDADGCFRNFVTGFPGSVHDGAAVCISLLLPHYFLCFRRLSRSISHLSYSRSHAAHLKTGPRL